MKLFVRAVASGFGFSLGAALFKRASKRIGLDTTEDSKSKCATCSAAADEKSEPSGEGDEPQPQHAT